MAPPVRIVALCIGRPGDDHVRWPPAQLQRLLRPSPASVPAAERRTIGDFWFDQGGHDLGASTALPWLEVPDGDPAWASLELCSTDFTANQKLSTALQELADAAFTLGAGEWGAAALRSADAILVVTASGSPLSWSQHVQVGPDSFVPCAHVPLDVTHTTMAHEVGHLLGYQHSFGLSTTGVGTEYGDPYCIMSARRLGGRTLHVTRCLTADLAGSDLLPGAPLWSMVGPGLARATAWAQHPDWPSMFPGVSLLDWPSGAVPVTVAHADLPARQGIRSPRLLVIPNPHSARWTTLEVRGPLPDGVPGADWDAALRLDREPGTGRTADRDASDAPGIVVHEVDDEGRVTYRGTVALPLGGDTDLSLGDPQDRLTIRATGYRDGVATALIGSTPTMPMAWARVEKQATCTVVHVLTAGYDEPVFTWRLDGGELVAGVRLGDHPTRPDPRTEVLWDELILRRRTGDAVVEIDVFEGGSPGREANGEPLGSQIVSQSEGPTVRVQCNAW